MMALVMHHEVGGDITAAQGEGTSLCSWLGHVALPAHEGHLPHATSVSQLSVNLAHETEAHTVAYPWVHM